MSYKQLTREQRYQLYRMNEMHLPEKEMGFILGFSASTISRVLRRNAGKRGHYTKDAHTLALQRMAPE